MGKALYRKHRSKSFDEVIGQSHITDTLKNALKKGAIAHAYLFTGPRGVGKTSIARILAHAVNDLPYEDESTHLDIIEIDAASNRRIDEIRELRDKVHIAPTSAKYKVYIIDEVHMLTREAFNALLKTLEEPPEHVVFILATTEAHKIPDTIISRTQRFTFKPIDLKTTVSHLKSIAKREGIPADDTALELIAQHGNGSFRDSISMLDQLSGLTKETYTAEDVSLLLGLPNAAVVSSVLDGVAQNDSDALFDAVRTMKEQGVDVNEAAKAIGHALRNQLISKTLQLDHHTTLQLLKDLLPLTAGSTTYVALELCLLSALHVAAPANQPANPRQSSSQTTSPPVSKNPPSSPPEPNTPPSTNKKTSQTLTPDNSSASQHESTVAHIQVSDTESAPDDSAFEPTTFSEHSWAVLLDDIKKKHNTLYGVLRMASASHDNSKVVLRFSYGFHKKRIDAPQNSAIIRTYLKKHFSNAEFATTVSKNELPKVQEAPKEAVAISDTTISSVSNIFGGAELLES